MKKIVSKFLLPLVIVGAALLLGGALVATKPGSKPVSVAEKAWLVSVQPVEPQVWSPTLVLYGQVESLWSSALTSALAADVAEVSVIEGNEVEKDELLVRLDDAEVRLELAQREADLMEAEARIALENTQYAANLEVLPREQALLALFQAEVDRTEDLLRKKVSAQSALDTARQAVERQAIALASRQQMIREHDAKLAELEARRARAEAGRDRARLDIERCRIRAPFDARIAKVLVSPGKRVRVGDVLVELYDTGAMVVRAQVPGRYLAAVRSALAAGSDLTVEGRIDDVPVTARLRGLAGEVASGSGGVEALFEIDGGSAVLQQGRFVRLNLALPERPGLVALPPEAIYGTDRVYRIDAESRMRPVRVERVGEARDGDRSLVLVRSDELGPGDSVISTQLPNAIDGLLVRLPPQGG